MGIISRVKSTVSKVVSTVTGKQPSQGQVFLTPSESGQARPTSEGGGGLVVTGGATVVRTTTGGTTTTSGGGGFPSVISTGGGSGGGGSSTPTQSLYGVTSPTITEIAKDIPKTTIYSGIISTVPTGPAAGYSSLKRTLADVGGKYEGKPLQKLYEAGRSFIIKSKEPVEKVIQEGETAIVEKVQSVYPSVRESKYYETQVDKFNQASETLDKDIEKYNKRYSEKQLTQEEYNQGLIEKQNLEVRTERRNTVAENLKARGIEVEKNLNKISVENVARGAAVGVVGAVTFFPKLIVSPVKTAKETVTSLAEIPQSLATSPGPTIGGIVGSLAAFYVGGKVYTRVVYGKQVDPVKLNSALETAEVKIKNAKGVTQESQLKVYKISEADKIQLGKDINLGHSVRVTEYEITHRSPKARKIIQQGLPNIKMTSIEVLDNVGNIISRKTIQAVEVKKGIFKYKDYEAGVGAGVFKPEIGIAEIDTVYARGKPTREILIEKPVKSISEIFKEKEVIKIEQPIYKKVPETGEILRLTKARSFTFEGAKVVAEKGKPITYKDLTEVVEAERFAKYPERTAASAEVQSLKNIKIAERTFQISEADILSVVGKEKTFKLEAGVGKATKISKPIEFKYSKAMKPFKEFKPEEIKVTTETPKLNKGQSQILKQVEKPVEFNVGQLPQVDFSGQLKQSVQRVAKQIKVKQPKAVFLENNQLNKQMQKAWQNQNVKVKELERELNKGKIETVVVNIPKQRGRGRGRQREVQALVQPQPQSPKQIQEQIQKLTQIQPPIQRTPNFPRPPKIPEITIPLIPFGEKPGAGYQRTKRLLKQLKKKEPSYAASLAAAAVQAKPFKVTRKQYAKLKRGTYTGIEARPVLEIVPEKNLKKALSKVQF